MFDSRINEIYGILLKSLCRMVVQCMATWRFRINGRTRKFRQCSWIKFDFCCFICLFRQAQKKLNEVQFSPVDILILECIFLIYPYLEISYLQQPDIR